PNCTAPHDRAGAAAEISRMPYAQAGANLGLRVEALGQRRKELRVAIRLGDAVEQQLDAFVRAHGRQHPAHRPDHLERALFEEELLAAGARALDVDGGEDPLLGELPVEDELAV